MPGLIRLAHLSDPHFADWSEARCRDFCNKRWIGAANNLLHRGRHYRAEVAGILMDDLNAQPVDHIVCTGDMTSIGLPAEFRAARAMFDRLTLGPERVTCIPGNHDVYVRAAVGRFEETFAPYCTPDVAWRWPEGESWPVVRVRGDLAVIGLRSVYPTPWFFAYGGLFAPQLRRLEAVLADARLAGKARVVLLHHPATGRYAGSWLRGLRGRGGLARVLGRAGAELVLHGHEHTLVEAELAGPDGRPIPVRGVESASYDGGIIQRTARYCIYTLGEGGRDGRPRLLEAAGRVYHHDSGGFVADERRATAEGLGRISGW